MQQLRILLLTVVLEGVLAGSFIIWANQHGVQFPWTPTRHEVLLGLLYTLPLLLFNFLLFGPLAKNFRFLSPLHRFCNEIIKPLADNLSLSSALLVSIAAGLGEELFFRGLLQSELVERLGNNFLAIALSAALFALLHFGVYVRRYFNIALVYALIGVYFGIMVWHEQSLWPAIISHAAYDFVALLYLRFVYIKPAKHPCEL